jgi:hypothetical protein
MVRELGGPHDGTTAAAMLLQVLLLLLQKARWVLRLRSRTGNRQHQKEAAQQAGQLTTSTAGLYQPGPAAQQCLVLQHR